MNSHMINVLLLEDNEADLLVIEEGLRHERHHGFALEHVEQLQALLARAQLSPPDIVLMDLCVGDSKGIATFLRARAALPDLPIVVQSGLEADGVALTAMRGGAQDYLVKGRFDGAQLVRALRYALERWGSDLALRKSEQRYALALDGAHDGIWDWDLQTGEMYFSPRWLAMLGLERGDITPTPQAWFDRVATEDVEELAAAIAHHTAGLAPHFEHEHRIRHRDGQLLWVRSRGLCVRDAAGHPTRMAGSLSDISAQKVQEARLRHDAFHDTLTGLANRALCLDRLGHAIQRASRSWQYRFALLFLDVDRFKTLNDSLGHVAGDALLMAVAGRLREATRPTDTVARMGGDEFCIICEDMRSQVDAVRVAERVHQALTLPFMVEGHEVFTTVSIGIAVHSSEHQTPADMLRDADLAMYRAKASGKGRHRVSDSGLHAAAVERMELETDLRRAVDRHELCLCYQPIVALDSGQTTGVEALVRWLSPGRGPMAPDVFIPLAEETGLIVQIGEWVLVEAVQQMTRWDREFGPRSPPLTVSVNVSPRQMQGDGLVQQVREALNRSGFDPRRLIIEVTENAFIKDQVAAAAVLSQLKALGVGIYLDDFGTGFSSLAYLQRLPIDRIKIDRSFVQGIATQGADWEIVRAIVALGASLGKGVIAEGIETREQMALLRDIDCALGQGYYFSRPVAEHPDAAAHRAAAATRSGRIGPLPRIGLPIEHEA